MAPLAPQPGGSSSRKEVVIRVVLANSCPLSTAFGLSLLVMVGTLAWSEMMSVLWLWIG